MSQNDKEKSTIKNEHQSIQTFYTMERDCFQKIKKSEETIQKEINSFKQLKKEYGLLIPKIKKNTNEPKENLNIKSNNEDIMDDLNIIEEKEDQIDKILKKRGLIGQKIDSKTAEEIKMEILSNLQERFLQRAEIIDNRFKEEKNNMKNLQKKYQKRNSETDCINDNKEFELDLYKYNLNKVKFETKL